MGEGVGNEEEIMPLISSANVACGYHAGDENTMWETVRLAAKHKVMIGAHPSFLDKENFGRTEMDLQPEEIYEMVTQQLLILHEIANSQNVKVCHVKPHGALYNLSAKNPLVARTITQAVKDFNRDLILFGLSGSHSIREAKMFGLRTCNEAFADRTYQDDGSLTPRSQPEALITDVNKCVQQVMQMIKERKVTTVSGKSSHIVADTVCIHGDGEHAVSFTKAIHEALLENKFKIAFPNFGL